MLALILASIIANGFLILRFSPSHFYKLHRYDGQLLYIKATFFGIFSTIFSFILDSYFNIIGIIGQVIPEKGLATFFNSDHLRESLIFFLFSALISILYCLLGRLWLVTRAAWLFKDTENSYSELGKILLMNSILNDSPMDRLLFLSYVQNIFLLITMSDRKVYVGRVISLGEPNEKQGPDQEISIVPVFSGYRDKDTLSVILNNSYSNVDDSKDFSLILKQDNIVSACEFVESLYQKLSERG